MGEVVDLESVRAALRRAMEKKGIAPTTLSLAVGSNRTLVKNLLEKNTDVQLSTLTKLSSILDVPLHELLAAPRVAVVGYIGAGGTIIFEEFESEEAVPYPPSVTGKLEALVVRGDSMLPAYKDGTVIYIQREHEGLLEDYLGEDCAVRLVTGETYLKQIIRGSEPGRFTLISLNAPPIENVEVEWATPIAFVLPARSRRLFS